MAAEEIGQKDLIFPESYPNREGFGGGSRGDWAKRLHFSGILPKPKGLNMTRKLIGQKSFIFIESYPNQLHQQLSEEKLQTQPHPQGEMESTATSPRGSRKHSHILKRKVASTATSHQEKFTPHPIPT